MWGPHSPTWPVGHSLGAAAPFWGAVPSLQFQWAPPDPLNPFLLPIGPLGVHGNVPLVSADFFVPDISVHAFAGV